MMNAITVERKKYFKDQIIKHKYLLLAFIIIVLVYAFFNVPYKTTFIALEDFPKSTSSNESNVPTLDNLMKRYEEARHIPDGFQKIEGEDPIVEAKRFQKFVMEKSEELQKKPLGQ